MQRILYVALYTSQPVSWNRFSLESLAAAKHDFELQQDGRVHVHLDHRHMGVGGDDSWSPSVHEVHFYLSSFLLHGCFLTTSTWASAATAAGSPPCTR